MYSIFTRVTPYSRGTSYETVCVSVCLLQAAWLVLKRLHESICLWYTG